MRRAVALLAVAFWACGAGAAELPSRGVMAKAAEPKAATCEIGGEQGVLLANGTCIRIGGDIDVGVGMETHRH